MLWTELPIECKQTLWRGSPIVMEIKNAVADGRCGELRSLRLTWMRPRKNACAYADFKGDLLSAAKDAVEYMAASPVEVCVLREINGENNLFGLMRLGNGIVSELELNEQLPDSMPDIFFVKANFSCGHLTNQPLTGYFNTEGMIQADAGSCTTLIAETPFRAPVTGVVEQMIQHRLELFSENNLG